MRTSRPSWSRWAVAGLLTLLPMVLYWPTIAHHFGFRDDYSLLHEAREEPGKILRVCAMQARPLYGWMIELPFRLVDDIGGLSTIRGLAALMTGAVAGALFLVLRALRWDRWLALLLALLVVVVPSSQVVVSWATAWPLAASLLLALLGFACAEAAFRAPEGDRNWNEGLRRGAWWTAAVGFVTASALVYQPNTMFYLTGVAAALWSRRRWLNRHGLEWLVRHGVTLWIGLAVAFTLMMVVFAQGWLPASRRVAFEQDWFGKFEWFVQHPLRNALGLVMLNRDGGASAVQWFAVVTGLVIAAGAVRGFLMRGWRNGLWWAIVVALLVIGSFSVNLAVSDRWPSYRVILPLTMTVAVALAAALESIGGRPLARVGLLALVLPGLWLARRQTVEFFALPQAAELEMLAAGASKIDPGTRQSVFVVIPFDEEHVTPDVFLDEFGSLSTNSYWAPKEMLALLMHERHPTIADVDRRYHFSCGPTVPKGQKFDIVINLHRLRELRPRFAKP